MLALAVFRYEPASVSCDMWQDYAYPADPALTTKQSAALADAEHQHDFWQGACVMAHTSRNPWLLFRLWGLLLLRVAARAF